MSSKATFQKCAEIIPSRDDRIYHAGLIDADGCISTVATWSNQQDVRVTLCQAQPTPCYRMQEFWGGRVSRAESSRAYYWVVSGRKAKVMLTEVGPFLKIKKREAQLALFILKVRTDKELQRKAADEMKRIKKTRRFK